MPDKRDEIYQWHVCNLRAVQKAIDDIARLARNAVARRDAHDNLQTLLRLLAFLISARAETRLQNILYVVNGFSEEQRANIQQRSHGRKVSHYDQWKKTIDMAFRKHYKLDESERFGKPAKGNVAHNRNMLINSLKNHLQAIINVRNSLAHGQWDYPLTADRTAVLENLREKINKENLFSLQIKYGLIRHLADVVHDLVIDRKTFAHDFERHFDNVLQMESKLQNGRYDRFEKALIYSRERGRRKRKS